MMFKIPSRLRVGCIDYTITWVDDIDDGAALGCCSEQRGEILLFKNHIRTADQTMLTFLHEVTHAILCNIDLDHFLAKGIDPHDVDEYLTEGISRIALQVIKDNCYEKMHTSKNKKNHKHTPRKGCTRK